MKKSDTFWYATMFGVVTGSAGALVMSIATHDAYDHTDSFYNPGIFSFIIFGVAFFIPPRRTRDANYLKTKQHYRTQPLPPIKPPAQSN